MPSPASTAKTITIDVNNITAGTANGATNGGTQNQTLSLATATTGLGTTGQFNITGGDGYTLAFGPLATANGTGQTGPSIRPARPSPSPATTTGWCFQYTRACRHLDGQRCPGRDHQFHRLAGRDQIRRQHLDALRREHLQRRDDHQRGHAPTRQWWQPLDQQRHHQ